MRSKRHIVNHTVASIPTAGTTTPVEEHLLCQTDSAVQLRTRTLHDRRSLLQRNHHHRSWDYPTKSAFNPAPPELIRIHSDIFVYGLKLETPKPTRLPTTSAH